MKFFNIGGKLFGTPRKKENKSSKSLEKNMELVKDILKNCDDIVYKDFFVGKDQNRKFTIVYTDGMTDSNALNQSVLTPLMIYARDVPPDTPRQAEKLFELVRYGNVTAGELSETKDIDKAIESILIGDAVLFIDGVSELIIIGAKGWPKRGISEPSSEAVVRGSKDGFVESFRQNTALVRRRIRDPRLKITQMKVGDRSKTDIGIFYIDDIVYKSLLEEVIRRIETIDIDAILDSGYIEQLIEDNPYSPFPQIIATERPDQVAAELYEGRVAIIVDNSPFALLVPATLNSLFQSPEDYYDRWIISSVLRVIRYTSSLLAMILPSLYIVFTSFHTGVLPTKLVLSIAASRQGVPFPAFIEALTMEFTLELLREAGIRLPIAIGDTIGIVGGLVIGEAAVRAGIVSPIMVVIVAITAIASFANPSYNLSTGFRLLRFSLMILSAILGIYGMMLGLIMIFIHLIQLKSFGIPYLSPFVSTNFDDYKDTVLRVPLYEMIKRPHNLSKNLIRMKNNRRFINKRNKGGDGN